ncbi:MAG: hypothetical protein ACT4NX_00510 [Deltaproteobacteria bacterium]
MARNDTRGLERAGGGVKLWIPTFVRMTEEAPARHEAPLSLTSAVPASHHPLSFPQFL